MVIADKKREGSALLGTILFHALLLLLLLGLGFSRVIPAESGGVELALGSVNEASGTFTPAPETSVSQSTQSDEMITSDEESVKIESTPKKQKVSKEQQEEIVRRREQEQQQKVITSSVMGAFSKASKESSRGTGEGEGIQGKETGTSDQGAADGTGYGLSGSLSGRGLDGTLPIPTYNSRETGTIEIRVVVDPSGRVVNAEFGKSNITDNRLREEARRAALRARFKEIKSVENVSGSITYIFNRR